MSKSTTLKLTYAAICLALCMVLPLFTGQIPEFGNMLLPMHLPIMLCGFLCGPLYGLGIGAIAPILRCFIFGMPPLFPVATAMAFELAAYGFFCGLFLNIFSRKLRFSPSLYMALIAAMLAGRLVWGGVSYLLYLTLSETFTWEMFAAGAFLNAFLGIAVQIVLVPVVILVLKKANLVPQCDEREES